MLNKNKNNEGRIWKVGERQKLRVNGMSEAL